MTSLWRTNREAVVSLAVLLALLVLLVVLLLGPVLYQADRYRSELRRDARVLMELRAIEAVQGDIEALRENYQERNLHEWVYANRGTDEISLDVQRKVTGWLAGAEVQRVTPVVSRADSEHVAVGVHVQLLATLEQLQDFLGAIERSRPLLVVENMRLTPETQRRTRDGGVTPQVLGVQMTVQTYVLAGEES